jgi:hypothetical protein
MPIPVNIKYIAGDLQLQNEEILPYFNRRTGESVTIDRSFLSMVEDAEEGETFEDLQVWEQDLIAVAREIVDSEDFLRLPSKYDIHEYQIMEDFCETLTDVRMANDILHRLRGSGAFGRFRAAIRYHNIEDDWYAFRDRAYEKIVLDWLEENNIEYTRVDA